MIAAWLVDGAIKGRLKPEPTKPFENEVTLSRPELGPVSPGQFATAADRVAGFAVAMVQGAPGSPRTLAVAVHDRLPGRPGAIARSGWSNKLRPKLEWRPGLDLWGPQKLPRRRRRPGRGGDDGQLARSPAGACAPAARCPTR